MKKRWLVTIALILIFALAACGSTGDKETKDVNEKSNNTTEKDNDEADEEEPDQDDGAVNEEGEETSIEKKPSEKDEESTDESEESSDTSSEDEEQSDDENAEKAKDEEDMIDLAFLAFDAQAEEDYEYLESILSEGSTLNKENNTIKFDNVTYPHEYEFLSKKDRDFLTERYVQMKEEEDRVLLGFEVTDYYDESSYVIDVVYVKENGEWKLNDMDINK